MRLENVPRRGPLCLAYAGIVWVGCMGGVVASADDAATQRPWHMDYFTMVTMPHLMTDQMIEQVGADAYRAATLFGGWYGAWYYEWQKTTYHYHESKPRTERLFHRNITYYDGGEVGDFVAFTDPDGKMVKDAWNIQSWAGAPPLQAHWFGMDSFFKKSHPFPFPNYEQYGLAPLTYPDGTEVSNVYEVLGRRNVDGRLVWNEPHCNLDVTDEQAQKSGLAAISTKHFEGEHVLGRNGWITCRQMTQDYANPQLRAYQAWDIARLTKEIKPDGWHIDNLGDNNLYRPFEMAMGVWSEHTFMEFMKRHFTPERLRELGIDDAQTFDIKAYLRERRALSATNPYAAYDETKWKDDLIFKCYLINHVRESVAFHAAKCDAIRVAARDQGLDVMVSGNLIPLFPGFSLLNGKLDVCHFEWNSQRDPQPSRRSMGLPPNARSGYIARLAAAVGRNNYSVVSLYVQHDLRGEEHARLFLAQAFEALPHRCVMDFGHAYLDQYSPGTPHTAGIFNRFIATHRCELSRRDWVADVGVVYDQWAEVASSTACQIDVSDFFNDYAGWCDYLSNTHRQWRVVLSTALTAEAIRAIPMIILPSAISLSDAHYDALETYLQNGGRVLASGGTGARHGPEGFLMKREVNPLERFKKYTGFRWITEQPAAAYWLTRDASAMRRMNTLIAWPDFVPVVETDAEIHVGLTVSRSLAGEPDCLSLDLNNNNFDLLTDQFIHTRPFSVTLRMPKEFCAPFTVSVAEPEKNLRLLDERAVQFDAVSRRLTIRVAPFECYQFIQIKPAGMGKEAS